MSISTTPLYLDRPLAGLLKRLKIKPTKLALRLNGTKGREYSKGEIYRTKLANIPGFRLKLSFSNVLHSYFNLTDEIKWRADRLMLIGTQLPLTYASSITPGQALHEVIDHPDLYGMTIKMARYSDASGTPVLTLFIDSQEYVEVVSHKQALQAA